MAVLSAQNLHQSRVVRPSRAPQHVHRVSARQPYRASAKKATVMAAGGGKKVLMLGGTRFIGVYLARQLIEAGHEVTLLTRGKKPVTSQIPDDTDQSYEAYKQAVKHIACDRTDAAALKEKLGGQGFEVVYDMNGREASDVEPVLDAVGDIEQYIFCSSAGVYLKSDQLPHREEDATDPKSRHKGKLDTEKLLQERGVNWTSVRPVYIYGPLNYNPVEEWFFHRIKAGRPIPVPGSGMEVTQLGHVKDLATAFHKCLGNPKAKGQIFNISGQRFVTFDGIAKACAKAAGAPEPELVHYNPKDFDFAKKKAFPMRPQHFFASIDKAVEELDWRPEYGLVEGLKDSWDKDFNRGTYRKEADFSTDDMVLEKELKEEVYALFKQHPELLYPVEEGLTKEQHRAFVRKQLQVILASGHSPMTYFTKDLKKYYILGEVLALVDLSLTVKMGVQYSLWGGSVVNLGTERHRKQYFDDIDKFKIPGCFCMTELGHGSNVAALQTECILDTTTDEWILNTPDEGAIKWWIGNAAEDGKMGTVFARLKVPSPDGSGALDDHGVHAFIVPLRDDSGNNMPGVEIRDCGYKVGLQGVDNGALRFTSVRLPRTNLLDRFATVDRSGKYSSPYSPSRRFAATLGELTGGRVGLTCSSVGVLKVSTGPGTMQSAVQGAVTIAVRYGAQRQQFGPSEGAEIAVLDYLSQQQKLMPMLATCYALHFTSRFLVAQYVEMKRSKNEDLVADVHSLSAGLKAYTTSYTAAALSTCRECCGGHGYAAVNRFGAWRSDHDIFQTFEGDNTVLLQQVAAMLLKQYKERFSGSPVQATWTYLRQTALDALPPNPLVSHDTEARHLRDPAFLVRMMRYRTARLLRTVAQRLRKHTPRLGAFQAWNKCLNHLLALARAHVESVMLTSILDGCSACPDADSRKSLKAMADLFALQRIHQEILFRNDDLVAPEKAKAIARMVEELCSELRGVAVPLVDAFTIPDHILRAPIGLSTSHKEVYAAYLKSIGWD
eukprot:jgi/Astpho2/7525/Aster-02090